MQCNLTKIEHDQTIQFNLTQSLEVCFQSEIKMLHRTIQRSQNNTITFTTISPLTPTAFLNDYYLRNRLMCCIKKCLKQTY